MISLENAEKQIELLFDFYGIDLDSYPDNIKSAMTFNTKKLLKGIQNEIIEVKENDDGDVEIHQSLKFNKSGENVLVYKVLTGKARIQMKDEMTQNERVYALLGSLSGWGKKAIESLRGKDLGLAEAIGLIFLQV